MNREECLNEAESILKKIGAHTNTDYFNSRINLAEAWIKLAKAKEKGIRL